MGSAAVSAIRHYCGKAAAARLTLLLLVIVIVVVMMMMTDPVDLGRVCVLRPRGGQSLDGISMSGSRHAVASGNMAWGMCTGEIRLTSKSLLNINQLPRARLHKPTPPLPGPLEACPTAHHPAILQIALVTRDDLHWRGPHILAALHAPQFRIVVLFQAVLLFNVNHVHEVVKGVKCRGVGDVVDEKEGIGLQVGGGPETAVFFLAGGVGE
jgi:hypothetical protein